MIRKQTGELRRAARLALALLLLLTLLPVCLPGAFPRSAVFAEEQRERELSIDFTIKPAEMVAPGDVTMTFVIKNESAFDVQNVYLTSADGLLSEPIGQLRAGESQTFLRPHTVTQEELDSGSVTYTLSHDSHYVGTGKVTYDLVAPIIKGDARPNVDFTRQISSEYVAKGGQLTITYRLHNTGNVAVNAVRIRDSLGDFTGRLEVLNIGETKTFISRVTINRETATEPVLEYTVPSGEGFTVRLDPTPIRLAESALDATLFVGRSVFDEDTADAVLTLVNNGNCNYTNITVLDDVYGGVIADSIVLPSGGNPVEVAYTYPIRDEAQYRWRITGTSGAGEALDIITDTMTLSAPETEPRVYVELRVAARTPFIRRAGRVSFDIAIENTGTAMGQDALLYEVTRGEIRKLAVLPTGDPIICTASYDVDQDAQFIFCLNYKDAEGHQRTVTTAPIDVKIGSGGELPESETEEAALELKGTSRKLGTSATFTILVIIAVVVMSSLIIILLMASRRARRERRQRQAAEKRRIKEEMGKTNPFTPLKLSKKKK